MNDQQNSKTETASFFRYAFTLVLMCLWLLHAWLLAERQPVDIPLTEPAPTTIQPHPEWPAKMTETRNEHIRLLKQAGSEKRIESLWAELADTCPIEYDWFIQDLGGAVGRWVTADDPAAVESELIRSVIRQLGEAKARFTHQLETLLSNPQTKAQDRLRLYAAACRQRRLARLRSLLRLYPQVVFVKHYDLGGSHYAYTEGQSDAQNEAHFVPGTALCQMDISGPWATCYTLLADDGGVIRDPDVSYDGRQILFAWKTSRYEDDYHLYEYDTATRQFSQITEGRGVSDYEGIYLPSGDLLFNSTRCVQTVDCWWTEVSNLYTCSSDGDFLRRLTFDQVHTNYPQVLPDGRVVYTRWDYNDRGQIYPQPLFQMNPDGTAQTEYYGNNSWFPTTIMHARPVPGSQKLIVVLSGHHSPQKGKLALIDPAGGRQENEGVQLIAPIRKTEAVHVDAYGQDGDQFQYPYAISEKEYMVGFCPVDIPRRHFGLYWMDSDGHRELLTYDARISCSQPVPLKEREDGHVRPNLVDYSKDLGTYYLQNVYEGPGLAGIPKGTAKKLRVVGLDFRAAGIGRNGNSGPGGGALSSTPPAIDNAGWDVKKVLGTAVIYEDGSAMFTVPDRTPVYFQVLDENNHAVQTMRSWSTLQPGETFSCIGCHEHKNQAPPPKMRTTQAMQAGPLPLEPFYGPPRGFSFPKEIQPILDRHCIQCHDQRPNAERIKGHAFSLLGTENVDRQAKRKWSDAYLALTRNGRPNKWVNWLGVQSGPSMLEPYSAGAAKSQLIGLLQRGHKGVKLSSQEMDKIACWIDLLVPYCGDYTEANAWTEDEIKMYEHFLRKRQHLQDIEKANIQRFMQHK